MSGRATPSQGRIDVEACRAVRNYTTREYLLRMVWGTARPLFRWSPRSMWWWRAGLLRLFGATVGRNVRITPSVNIFAPWRLQIGSDSSVGYDVIIYNLGPICIGERVTISQRVHLCAGTHDYTDPRMPLLKTPITIEDEAWVCADAFVGPDVIIHQRAVVGGRAVVTRDVPKDAVVAGNPAVQVKTRVMKNREAQDE